VKLSVLSCTVASIICSSTALAVENDDIERMLVTASPFAQKLSDTPNSVFIVSKEEIEAQRAVARNLSEVISNLVPGFSPSTETMSTFGQNFRGGKAIVMIDGVIISTTLRAGGRDLQSIAVDAIESIEVIKGASALYGNGEAGAIINVVTKGATANTEMKTSFGVEFFTGELSDTGYSLSHTVSGTTESDLGFMVNLSAKDRGNLYDSKGDLLPGAPNSQGGMGDADEYDILVKLEKDLTDSQIGFLAHHYKIENKLHYKRTVNDENGLVAIDKTQPYDGANPQTELTTAQITYDHYDILGQQLSLSAYVSKVNVGYESASEITSKRYGLKAAMQLMIDQRSQLIYGFEYGFDNTEQGRMRDVTVGSAAVSQYICSVCDLTETKLSPFVQYSNQLTNDLTLQTGIRYENFAIDIPDYQRYKNGNLSAKQGDRLSYNKALFNLGLVYTLAQDTEAFVNFSQGYSHGDMRMLRDMPVATVSEFAKEIPATQTNYHETGVRYNSGALNASLALFYSDITNGYGYDYNVDADSAKRVAAVIVADAKVWGYEATVDYRVNDQLILGSTVSQSEGKRKNGTTGVEYWMNDTKITPLKATFYANYQVNDSVWLRLQANYVGDRDKNKPESDQGYSFYESPYKGYTLVDLISTVDTDFGRLTLGVDNLFNTDYQPLVSQMNKEVTYASYRNQFSGYGRRLSLEYSITY